MKDIVELAKTKTALVLVGTVCLLFLITEVKKSVIEIKLATKDAMP